MCRKVEFIIIQLETRWLDLITEKIRFTMLMLGRLITLNLTQLI